MVNTIAADALAPCVAKTSAAMVLNVSNKKVLVFNEEAFQQVLPTPCQWWEIIENVICL